jgi:hypothetical protein
MSPMLDLLVREGLRTSLPNRVRISAGGGRFPLSLVAPEFRLVVGFGFGILGGADSLAFLSLAGREFGSPLVGEKTVFATHRFQDGVLIALRLRSVGRSI